MKKRIALLYGGASSEHDVSVMGYKYVKELLTDTDYDLLPVYVDRSGEWSIRLMGKSIPAYLCQKNGGSLYTGYGFIDVDCAIPLLHGEGGEDGSIQGALEHAHVPYVGSGVSASALCIDKVYAKTVARDCGIPTLPHLSFTQEADALTALGECRDRLGMPVFIKPRRLGSSVGAFPVLSDSDFIKLLPLAMEKGKGLVMAERMLEKKRELECAFFEAGGERIITPPGEIIIDGFYGWDEKYGGRTKTLARAELDDGNAKRITEYARLLADALCLRHLARIDFFLSEGEIYFNEVNTFPGFTRESLYPKMLKENGIDPKDALVRLIEDALS